MKSVMTESNMVVDGKMENSFDVLVVNQDRDSITIELRRELIGPIADSLIRHRYNGRKATRFALGKQMLMALDILKGRVNTDKFERMVV